MARAKASASPQSPRSAKILSAEALVALGAERLADLIMSQTKADPVFARTVRMALAAKADSSSLARELDKRLKTIRRSTSFVEWDKIRPLARELEQLRQTIMGPLAEQSLQQAAEQMQLFLSLAESIYARADDSGGYLSGVFRQGGEDLGVLWVREGTQKPEKLAETVLALIEADGYGTYDELLGAVSPALGRDGRAAIRRLLAERQAGLSGEALRRYGYKVNWLLPALADLDDDVDAYIATVDQSRQNNLQNAKVAARLLAHNRAEEALEWIDAPTERHQNDYELALLRVKALDSLGRKDLAQAERYRIFATWLDADMLRLWLKASPDFDDFETKQTALDLVVHHEQPTAFLKFLIDWPDFKRAGRLVRERLNQLDARDYDVLRSAAEALASCDPGAAILLHRVLVSGVLDRAQSKYYSYAAKDYKAAQALASGIMEDGSVPTHEVWQAELQQKHGRKIGFWSLLKPGAVKPATSWWR